MIDWGDVEAWLLTEGGTGSGLAPATVDATCRAYRTMARAGFPWHVFKTRWGRWRPPDAVKIETRPWLAALRSAKGAETLRLYQKCLNRFGAYVAAQDGRWGDVRWTLAKAPRRRLEPYSDQELAALDAYRHPVAFVDARRRALLWVLRNVPLRRVEVHRMRVEHFQWHVGAHGALLVPLPAKDGEPRQVPLPPDARLVAGSLQVYLAQIPQAGALWRTVSGDPMSLAGFSGEIYDVARSLAMRIKFNRFRHTFLTRFGERGGRLQTAQRIVGHGGADSTLWYMRVPFSALEEDLEAARARGL